MGVYRKGEVALSRIFWKLQEGWEARGEEGDRGIEGSLNVCPLNWELLAVIKPYNPLRKMYIQNLVKKPTVAGKCVPVTCTLRKKRGRNNDLSELNKMT